MDGDHLSRRRVLAGATGVVGAIAGCLGIGSGDDGSDSGDDGPDSGDGGSGADVPPDGIGDGKHRFYLANLDDDTHRVELSVYDTFAEEYVIDGRYELPDERGAEFAPVAGVEIRYDVEVDVVDGGSTTVEWIAGSCEEYGNGSQNAVVRIQPGATELTYVEDNCDELVAGASVPFAPASEYFVDER